jgi:uncharacterized membrane protein YqhA
MSIVTDPPHALRPLPRLLFASRWLQVPLYLGLIVAQAVYVWQFLKELLHLVPLRTGIERVGRPSDIDGNKLGAC